MKKRIVLASASPRRKNLLENCDFEVEIHVSNIEEKVKVGESPEEYVLRNAKEKAMAVADSISGLEGKVIVSADTIVVSPNGKIMEKPEDDNDARRMLMELSNATHHVLTGYALVKDKNFLKSAVIKTFVTFRKLYPDEIEMYLQQGEHKDKSGSYGIQGKAMGFVESMNGSLSNVTGLPVSHVLQDLRELGIL